MKRKVFYMAHPVSGDVEGNLKRAMRWLAWLRKSSPGVTFIAPWIASIMAGDDDADPTQREAGLIDCETVAGRCDGIVLVGGRVSSGMAREREAVIATGGCVFNLTGTGIEPPSWDWSELQEKGIA